MLQTARPKDIMMPSECLFLTLVVVDVVVVVVVVVTRDPERHGCVEKKFLRGLDSALVTPTSTLLGI